MSFDDGTPVTKYLSYCCPSVNCVQEHERGFVDPDHANEHIYEHHGANVKPIVRRWPHPAHEYVASGPLQ